MNRLSQALKVRSGEGRMAALLIGLIFFTSAGGSIGGNAIDALFFARFGVQYLPYMYVALGLVTFITSLAVTALLARVARERLYLALPAVLAFVLVVERGVLSFEFIWFYPFVWLAMNVMGSLQGLLTWGLASAVCDTRQAKRLFPLFSAGGIFGAVVGGLGTRPLVDLVHAENLLLVWAVALGLAFLVGRALVGRRAFPRGLRRRGARLSEDLQQGVRTVRRSPLLRWIALAVVPFSVLFFSLAFPFSKAATAEFPTADSLAGFLGIFQGAATGAAFLASLLLANRVYARFGIMSAILALAAIYLVGFSALAFAAPFAALVAFRFIQQTWLSGVVDAAYQAVFNVIPPERRDQTRAFMNGVPGQAGIVIAGLILVVGEQALRPQQLYLIGLAAAILATFLVWRASRAYGRALVDALRAGMPQLFFSEEEPFGGFRRDAAATATVLAGITAPDPLTRRISVEVLGNMVLPAAAAALARALDDPDPEVRAAALRGIARCGVGEAADRVAALLGDDDPQVRARAAVALLRDGPHVGARDALRALASSGDVAGRVAGLNALGEVRDGGAFDLVSSATSDPRAAVRRAAVGSLAAIDRERSIEVLARLLADPDRSVREATAEALGRVGPPALAPILGALSDRARVDAALAALALLPSETAASAVREFARTEVAAALRYHELERRADAADGDEGVRLLAESLRRSAQREATRALRAVGVLGDRHAIALAIQSLTSREAAQRANASEALESLGERELVRPLLQLWEPAGAAPRRGDGWLSELANDPDPWLRECASFVAKRHEGGGASLETLATLSVMERIIFLRRVPLFAELPPADLKQVATIADEQLYPDGEVIFRQGEPGDEMHVIVSGEVRVISSSGGAEVEIARRRPGEFVGEMSVISQEPRSATLVAAGEVRTLRIDRRQFEALLRERPETSLAVMRVLTARLRERT